MSVLKRIEAALLLVADLLYDRFLMPSRRMKHLVSVVSAG
jgi:hypothetical protein